MGQILREIKAHHRGSSWVIWGWGAYEGDRKSLLITVVRDDGEYHLDQFLNRHSPEILSTYMQNIIRVRHGVRPTSQCEGQDPILVIWRRTHPKRYK